MHSELCHYGVRHGDLRNLNILQVEKGSQGDDEEKTGVSMSPVHSLQYEYRIIDLESAILTWETREAMQRAARSRIKRIVSDIDGYR